jgi:uncharacterized membrane protein
MLIVFPLGLLATAVAFDIVGLASGDNSWFGISFWMIAAGIIGGLLAAIFGLIDWWAIPSGTRAKAIGLWHGLGNVIVVLLFIISWFMRKPMPTAPSTGAFVLSFIAVISPPWGRLVRNTNRIRRCGLMFPGDRTAQPSKYLI